MRIETQPLGQHGASDIGILTRNTGGDGTDTVSLRIAETAAAGPARD